MKKAMIQIMLVDGKICRYDVSEAEKHTFIACLERVEKFSLLNVMGEDEPIYFNKANITRVS